MEMEAPMNVDASKKFNFKVTAPGKVILFGEHAVVYSKTAIAASLDLRTSLEYNNTSPDLSINQMINLTLPKIRLRLEIPIEKIRKLFVNPNGKNLPKFCEENYEIFYRHIQEFIDVNIGFTNNQQKYGLEAFFFLFSAIIQMENLNIEPFEVLIDSTLSINSGLGSSASYSVCIATCFLHLANLQRNRVTDLNKRETLELISAYALSCEKIMHGRPSGIDNSICTYGSIIEFKREEKLEPIFGAKPMSILLVDTRVPRSTKLLVNKLAGLKKKYPQIYDPVMDSIESVSNNALNLLKRLRDLSPTENQTEIQEIYTELVLLMEINQNLLSTCQVSHPSLDRICAEAKNYGLGAKLTGAGGGGYAYILLLPDTPTEIIASISKKLIADGYIVTLTNLGGPGVQIHNL